VVTDPEGSRGLRKTAGTLMSSQSVHAISSRTLRHWTIDSRDVVGGSQWPAPALPFSEQPDGARIHLLVSRLARVKSDLARRFS